MRYSLVPDCRAVGRVLIILQLKNEFARFFRREWAVKCLESALQQVNITNIESTKYLHVHR